MGADEPDIGIREHLEDRVVLNPGVDTLNAKDLGGSLCDERVGGVVVGGGDQQRCAVDIAVFEHRDVRAVAGDGLSVEIIAEVGEHALVDVDDAGEVARICKRAGENAAKRSATDYDCKLLSQDRHARLLLVFVDASVGVFA